VLPSRKAMDSPDFSHQHGATVAADLLVSSAWSNSGGQFCVPCAGKSEGVVFFNGGDERARRASAARASHDPHRHRIWFVTCGPRRRGGMEGGCG
jgi:hypothetical protein